MDTGGEWRQILWRHGDSETQAFPFLTLRVILPPLALKDFVTFSPNEIIAILRPSWYTETNSPEKGRDRPLLNEAIVKQEEDR